MNPAEGCLRHPSLPRDIVDARTGVWHTHMCIPLTCTSIVHSGQASVRARVCASISTLILREAPGEAGARAALPRVGYERVHTHTHIRTHTHMQSMRDGWRQKAFVARSTCLCGSFPAKLSVPEQQSSRLAELLPGTARRVALVERSILRKPHK